MHYIFKKTALWGYQIWLSLQDDKIKTRTKTKTKTEKYPTCAIFSKSRHFEDIKFDTERGCSVKVRKSEIQQCYFHLFLYRILQDVIICYQILLDYESYLYTLSLQLTSALSIHPPFILGNYQRNPRKRFKKNFLRLPL